MCETSTPQWIWLAIPYWDYEIELRLERVKGNHGNCRYVRLATTGLTLKAQKPDHLLSHSLPPSRPLKCTLVWAIHFLFTSQNPVRVSEICALLFAHFDESFWPVIVLLTKQGRYNVHIPQWYGTLGFQGPRQLPIMRHVLIPILQLYWFVCVQQSHLRSARLGGLSRAPKLVLGTMSNDDNQWKASDYEIQQCANPVNLRKLPTS